jgi:uncharacterized protein (DUF3820 family)
VWFTETEFPRGDTGKLLKRALKAQYAPLVVATERAS